MDKQIAEQWAAELESGKHKHGTNILRNGADEKCCMGVLCELAVAAHVIPPPKLNSSGEYSYAGDCALPPREVLDWSGLRNDLGDFGGPRSLVGMNDKELKTFPELAPVIRKNWKAL